MFTSKAQVQSYVTHAPGKELRELLPDMRDVLTLVLISCITGAFIACALGVITGLLNHPHPYKVAFASWTILQAGIWLLLLLRWSKMLNLLESSLGVDINGDGRIAGAKPAKQERVKLELGQNTDGGRAVDFIDLPVSQEQLIKLASGLMSGSSFSESGWTGAGAPFSRSEFAALRDEMLKRNLLQWRNSRAPAQGLELSPGGKACMRYFASMTKQEVLK